MAREAIQCILSDYRVSITGGAEPKFTLKLGQGDADKDHYFIELPKGSPVAEVWVSTDSKQPSDRGKLTVQVRITAQPTRTVLARANRKDSKDEIFTMCIFSIVCEPDTAERVFSSCFDIIAEGRSVPITVLNSYQVELCSLEAKTAQRFSWAEMMREMEAMRRLKDASTASDKPS